MRLILIRHGEPDYGVTRSCGVYGHALNFAPLTQNGITQAEAVSKDERLKGAEFIVSSPYTRALQTAAIISRNTGLEIKIEHNLHEWLQDSRFIYGHDEHEAEAAREFARYKGARPADSAYRWENVSDLGERAFNALYKYADASKVIAVCHGWVMKQFVYAESIPYCGILEMNFNRDSKWNGWVEH